MKEITCGVGHDYTANKYQRDALRTEGDYHHPICMQDTRLIQGLLGLCGEAGECADILKKTLFQGHTLDKVHLAKELGDCAWYLALAADAIGYSLEEVLQMNIDKLQKRYPNGFDPELSVHRDGGDE